MKPNQDAFFTRASANEGIEFDLTLPDGTPTEHKIRIRGVDSDAFKAAEAMSKRSILELAAIKDEKVYAERVQAAQCLLMASLVISWSFEQECTPANVATFLREAPQITEQIDRLAFRRSLFTKASSNNSTPSSEASSSLPNP